MYPNDDFTNSGVFSADVSDDNIRFYKIMVSNVVYGLFILFNFRIVLNYVSKV